MQIKVNSGHSLSGVIAFFGGGGPTPKAPKPQKPVTPEDAIRAGVPETAARKKPKGFKSTITSEPLGGGRLKALLGR